MKKIIALLAGLILLLFTVSAQANTVFSQGFETDTLGWFDGLQNGYNYGTITRVASGTNSINAASGSYYAVVQNGPNSGDSAPFTRFGGYSSTWPAGGFTASIDIYLDTSWTAGSGFDYDVAASNSSGDFLRDFIFHVAQDISSGQLIVAADNNTNFATREDLDTLANHYVVTTSGWYTFQQKFYDDGGTLACDLSLLDSAGDVLFTQTLSNSSDLISSVGGNRYGWFDFVDVGDSGLAIDNTNLQTTPIPGGLLLLGAGLLRLGRYARRKRSLA